MRQHQPDAPTIVDVRTPAEYEQVHALGARSVPLDDLDPSTFKDDSNSTSNRRLLVICKSGRRAAKACEKLRQAGIADVLNVEGGTDAWVKAGLPVVRGAGATISMERQVRIGAGLLVLLGVGLAWHVHPAFDLLCGFVGAGLVFAGITDWCGMAILLSKMPWNRRSVATPPSS